MSRFSAILVSVLLSASFAAGEDWPMLGRDPGRSGWTEDTVRAPVRRLWYRSFHEEGIACGNQPVIVDGRVYLGTMHGVMHAMDAATGEDLWTARLDGGILHSAAVVDGRCFVGSLDGRVYALDAVTGQTLWAYRTGLGIWNAPVVVDGTVYIGSRDGFFYAFEAETGQLRWRTELGGPILCSPAYADGRVFTAAENMTAYGLDAATGEILWTGQLYGVSARGYHPVVAGGKVFFTTQPGLGKYGTLDVLLDACRELGLRPRQRVGADPRGPEEPRSVIEEKDAHNRPLLQDPNILTAQLERVRQMQADSRRHTRTLFAFDAETGQEPFIIPQVWQESCGGTGNPPIVAPDGQVWVKFALFTWSKHGEYFPYTRIGRIDLDDGFIHMLRDPMNYGYPIGMTHDEMARLTGSGDMIIHAREGYPGFRGIVGIDMNTQELQTLGDNIHFGDWAIGPNNLLRVIRGETITPGMEYVPRGAGVFGGVGTYAAVSIADDTLYYIPGHEGRSQCMLIAWQSNPGGEEPIWQDPGDRQWRDLSYRSDENIELLRDQPLDWDMLLSGYGRCWPENNWAVLPEPEEVLANRAEQAEAYAAALSDEHLASYIWQVDRPDPSAVDEQTRRQLTDAVEQWIASDWMPMRFPDLMFSGWVYYDDPAEAFEILAAAYPMLAEATQQRVRAYLRERLTEANPLTVEHLPMTGRRRTAYELPEYTVINRWTGREPGLRRVHALWAWADATGDWDLLEPIWRERIRPIIFRLSPPEGAEAMLHDNALLSGAIAYARIARHFEDAPAERAGVAAATAMLRLRIEAERTYEHTRFLQMARNTQRPGRYLYLTPTIGRVVRDHALGRAEGLYELYIAHHRPTWYLAWGPLVYHSVERSLDHPINPWATFCARAMIFEDSPDQLRAVLDLPWSQADPYYVHKLALIARASDPR